MLSQSYIKTVNCAPELFVSSNCYDWQFIWQVVLFRDIFLRFVLQQWDLSREFFKIQAWYETEICTGNAHWHMKKIGDVINLDMWPVSILQARDWLLITPTKRENDGTTKLQKGTLYESFNFIPHLKAKK